MKKLLIVDDNPLNVFTLKNHLRHSGLVTDSATCAADTYALHQKNLYDIILLDYHLPDATGLDIARNIIEHDRQLQGHKTILVSISADSNQEMQEILLASGIVRVLNKPITRLQLLEALQPYVHGIDLSEIDLSEVIGSVDNAGQVPGIHFYELKKWLPANRHEAHEFIAEFIRTTREGIRTLQQAAREHNLSKIILEAHRLKTPPRAFGMHQLATQLEALQQAAQNGQDQSRIDSLLHALQLSLRDIEQQLLASGFVLPPRDLV